MIPITRGRRRRGPVRSRSCAPIVGAARRRGIQTRSSLNPQRVTASRLPSSTGQDYGVATLRRRDAGLTVSCEFRASPTRGAEAPDHQASHASDGRSTCGCEASHRLGGLVAQGPDRSRTPACNYPRYRSTPGWTGRLRRPWPKRAAEIEMATMFPTGGTTTCENRSRGLKLKLEALSRVA